MPQRSTRRHFLQTTAAAASLAITHSQAFGNTANGKLRTAHVGVGGMGGADLSSISRHKKVEVAALCDVDEIRLKGASAKHPDAKTFRDYREMISALGDTIDAVVVSTPDHTHAPVAMTALNAGKPVYCQKPLTHEVYEARRMRQVAESKGLVTQMGIQIHSSATYRQAVAMIQSGVIGKVSQVHAWSNKNWGYDGEAPKTSQKTPTNLDWNLWLGTSEQLPFAARIYHPGQWRKMIPFGTGTLGDMGVHIFDTPYAALALTAPKWARTTCRQPTGIGHPEKNIVEYEFPGTKYTTDSMLWTWYDGAFAPPKDLMLPEGLTNLPKQGALFIGEGGAMLLPHVSQASLYPVAKFKDYQRPQVENGNHYFQFVDACLGVGETSAPFAYAGPLTEALLLGVVANRFPGKKLDWDPQKLSITDQAEANELLRRDYRTGFEVENL
jgi:predicted dehydrogenase